MAALPEAPTPTLTAIYADYEARQGDGLYYLHFLQLYLL